MHENYMSCISSEASAFIQIPRENGVIYRYGVVEYILGRKLISVYDFLVDEESVSKPDLIGLYSFPERTIYQKKRKTIIKGIANNIPGFKKMYRGDNIHGTLTELVFSLEDLEVCFSGFRSNSEIAVCSDQISARVEYINPISEPLVLRQVLFSREKNNIYRIDLHGIAILHLQ